MLYTKIVLSLIAVALLVIAFKLPTRVVEAGSSICPRHDPCYMRIVP